MLLLRPLNIHVVNQSEFVHFWTNCKDAFATARGSSPWGVIHYDLPRRIDDYVHRSGRTGRFGREGLAIGFANGAAKGISGDLVKNLLEAGTKPPPWLLGISEWTKSFWWVTESLWFCTQYICIVPSSSGWFWLKGIPYPRVLTGDDSDEASRYVTIWILGERSLTKICLATFIGTLKNYDNLGHVEKGVWSTKYSAEL